MANPLQSIENSVKRIIVTRPAKQSPTLVERLQKAPFAADISTLSIPSLGIESVFQAEEIAAVKNAILALDEYELLIFVSQNAANHGFDWIEDFWPQFPEGVRCLSIGAKTEQVVNERLRLFAGQACESRSGMSMDSESLLALDELRAVNDKKILIFRGVGGRTLLYTELSARGARVDYCELYHRVSPEGIKQQIQQHQVNPGSDLLTVFSAETLHNFHQALCEAEVENWHELPVLVPGERVKAEAESLGYRHIHCAANASEEAMCQALSAVLAH
jgi:uroporphyrinogen-III synthase